MIKRFIKRSDRVYTPLEYANMVTESSASWKFTTVLYEENFSIDYKNWWPQNFKKTTLATESKVPKNAKVDFQISKYYTFEINHTHTNIVKAHEFIDGLKSYHFKLGKSEGGVAFPTQMAYQGKCPINDKKIGDIKQLKKYIPYDFLELYDEVCEWPTTAEKRDD